MTRNAHGFETDYDARKAQPIVTGVLDYFPLAILAVAEVSNDGNAQHNPGEPLHWAREKSQDEVNTLARHLLERGELDGKVRHLAKAAWRVLAALQKEIEAAQCINGACEVHHGDGKDHGGSCSLLPRAATWYGRTRDHTSRDHQYLIDVAASFKGGTTIAKMDALASKLAATGETAERFTIVICDDCDRKRRGARMSKELPPLCDRCEERRRSSLNGAASSDAR